MAAKKKHQQPSEGADEAGPPIPENFFEFVGHAVFTMFLLFLFMLVWCVLDPDDLAIIPGIGQSLSDLADGLAIVSYVLIFTNIAFTILVYRLCKEYGINSEATSKWIGQTFIVGFPSYKMFKDAVNN